MAEHPVRTFEVCLGDRRHSPAHLDVTTHRLLLFGIRRDGSGGVRRDLVWETPINDVAQLLWRDEGGDEILILVTGREALTTLPSLRNWPRPGESRPPVCPALAAHDPSLRRELGALLIEIAEGRSALAAGQADEVHLPGSRGASVKLVSGESVVRQVRLGFREHLVLTTRRLVLSSRTGGLRRHPQIWELPVGEIAMVETQTTRGGPLGLLDGALLLGVIWILAIGVGERAFARTHQRASGQVPITAALRELAGTWAGLLALGALLLVLVMVLAGVPVLRATHLILSTRSMTVDRIRPGVGLGLVALAIACILLPVLLLPLLVMLCLNRLSRPRHKRTTLARYEAIDTRLCSYRISTRTGRHLARELGALLGDIASLGDSQNGGATRATLDARARGVGLMLGETEQVARRYEIPSSLYGRDLGHLYLTNRRLVLHRRLGMWRWQVDRCWELSLGDVSAISAESIATEEYWPRAVGILLTYLRVFLPPGCLFFWWIGAAFVVIAAGTADGVMKLTHSTPIGAAAAFLAVMLCLRGLAWLWWTPRQREALTVSTGSVRSELPLSSPNLVRRRVVRGMRNVQVSGMSLPDRAEQDPFCRARAPLGVRRPPAAAPTRPLVPARERDIPDIVTKASEALAALLQGQTL